MATSYTDIWIQKILRPLEGLITNEFPGISVVYEPERRESFFIKPEPDTLSNLRTDSEVRIYPVQIIYKYIIESQNIRRYEKGTIVTERLKRLIHNNTKYTASGTYYWFDGKVVESRFEDDFEFEDEFEIDEEDNKKFMNVIIDCEFTREDVKT